MTEHTARALAALPGRAWIVYAVVEAAKSRPFTKVAALADAAGVSTATARRALADLRRAGFIRWPRGYPHRAEPIPASQEPTRGKKTQYRARAA